MTGKQDRAGLFIHAWTELEHLRKRDRTLSRPIDEVGKIERLVTPHPFIALIHTIVAQQISSGLKEQLGGLSPQSIAAVSSEELRRCEMFARKTGYFRGIVTAAMWGEVDLGGLHDLSDFDVIRRPPALPGIGRWTAEMYLIVSLQRPDVVAGLTSPYGAG